MGFRFRYFVLLIDVMIYLLTPKICFDLQADSRVNNQRTRVYIALELPSSVEVAIQHFCSTHRCNQVSLTIKSNLFNLIDHS